VKTEKSGFGRDYKDDAVGAEEVDAVVTEKMYAAETGDLI
jgi:hypothetical protein